jgi:hypothetical protein
VAQFPAEAELAVQFLAVHPAEPVHPAELAIQFLAELVAQAVQPAELAVHPVVAGTIAEPAPTLTKVHNDCLPKLPFEYRYLRTALRVLLGTVNKPVIL